MATANSTRALDPKTLAAIVEQLDTCRRVASMASLALEAGDTNDGHDIARTLRYQVAHPLGDLISELQPG